MTEKTPEQIAAEEAAAESARREADAAEDKRVKAEDQKSKMDMDDTGDAVLDDGHTSVPIKQDPFNARKLIYKRAGRNRETIILAEADNNADVAAIRDAISDAAAKGTGNELDRSDDFDTNRDERASEEERRAARAAAQKPEGERNDPNAGVDDGNTMVKVTVLGREFEVPKRDVDADGGVVAYQKNRAADERLRNASKAEQELAAERKRIEDAQAALAEQQRAIAEAASTAASSSTRSGDEGTGDVAAEAQAITDSLYSGDRANTKAAISKILARQGGKQIDAAEVARQAVALMKQELQKEPAAPVEKPVEAQSSVDDPEIADVNAYMATNHADLLKDPVKLPATQAKFNELRKLPENANRRLRDIARDAVNATKDVAPHPRAERVEQKKSLPPVPSGSQAHSSPSAPAAPSNSSHVERMRKARGLPT